MNRRTFLGAIASIAALFVQACRWGGFVRVRHTGQQRVLHDTHSRLTSVRVAEVVTPNSCEAVREAVLRAGKIDKAISLSGYRHAMGGQQFAQDALHLDLKAMNRVLAFDQDSGLIHVEGGIAWPELINYYLSAQVGNPAQWGIAQKQTGADYLSLAGSLSANAHGRGLTLQPLVQDIEQFELLDADGTLRRVSRTSEAELFNLAIGGYGLFGAITSVQLRLTPRVKLERVVEIVSLDALPDLVRSRINEGYLYGDFQYKTDEQAKDFMEVGVFSCYRPISNDAVIETKQRQLGSEDWNALLLLAFTDKAKAFEAYSQYYLSTHGQRYWSDTHQLSYYDESYHERLAAASPRLRGSTLMITEVYVPHEQLVNFTRRVAKVMRARQCNVVYGTMRLIKKDEQTFLAWAKQDYACIIFNLEVRTDAVGLAKAESDFQALIDCALEYGGSYFLTYHRFARKDQVLAAYPQFVSFLEKKLDYDPEERFQSEWYRHYRSMFGV